MLGKGLESLIPPRKSGPRPEDGRIAPAPAEAPVQSGAVPEKTQPASSGAPARAMPVPKNQPQRPPRGADAVFQIEVVKIKPNPHQPRRNFDEAAIGDLAASIREFGIIQPIVVTKVEKETPSGADVEYVLIAGERRLLASKRLGLERVPAIVRSVDLERERLEMAIIENLQREDLNPIEKARAFSRLQDEFSLAQREIASRLGKSREAIANAVRLLDLPSSIQEALIRGDISESHGRLLLAVEGESAREKIFRDLLRDRMTTRELTAKVRRAREPSGGRTGAELAPELKIFEERLSAELSAPVSILKSGETGKIVITFYSPDELKNIIGRFAGEADS